MSPAITPAAATAVVDSYELRARFARADVDAVSRPRLLRGLLRTARHVAEVPCGAGHFLADYAATGVKTTLIDGNGAMLAAAIEHAAEIGLPAGRTHAHVQYVQALGELAPPKFRTPDPIRSGPERRGLNARAAQEVHA